MASRAQQIQHAAKLSKRNPSALWPSNKSVQQIKTEASYSPSIQHVVVVVVVVLGLLLDVDCLWLRCRRVVLLAWLRRRNVKLSMRIENPERNISRGQVKTNLEEVGSRAGRSGEGSHLKQANGI